MVNVISNHSSWENKVKTMLIKESETNLEKLYWINISEMMIMF